jgi:hypothetical protein
MDDQETAEGAGATGEDRRGARSKVSDVVREGLGVLSAFKDVLEETIRQRRGPFARAGEAGAPLSYVPRTGSGGRGP